MNSGIDRYKGEGGVCEEGGGLPTSWIRSRFPHAMQSHIWKNTRWVFLPFVGYAGGRTEALQTGDEAGGPEEDLSPPILGVSWNRLDF